MTYAANVSLTLTRDFAIHLEPFPLRAGPPCAETALAAVSCRRSQALMDKEELLIRADDIRPRRPTNVTYSRLV
jgi:hypothetical protein